MSEEKKYTKTEEIREEIKNLTEEELAQVTGGVDSDFNIKQHVFEGPDNNSMETKIKLGSAPL